MTSMSQEWNINNLTPSQWNKFIAEIAHNKGNNRLYWNGGIISNSCRTNRLPIPGAATVSSLLLSCGKLSLRDLLRSKSRQERSIGRDFLKQFNILLAAEDERIKNLASTVLLRSVKSAVREIDESLDLSNTETFFTNALHNHDVVAIKDWIMFGGDVNKTMWGYTPISHVLRLSSSSPEIDFSAIIEVLIEASDVFIKSPKDSFSAFDVIIDRCLHEDQALPGKFVILMQFFDKFKKASPEEKPLIATKINEALSFAIRDYDLTHFFLEKFLQLIPTLTLVGADINVIKKDGLPLLAFAMQQCDRILVERLIKLEADPRPALKKLGMTKLMFAALRGDLEAVKRIATPRTKTLLCNAKDKRGNSALIWAVRMGHVGVVKYLVDLEVDLNAKNKQGFRAWSYAINPEISAILDKADAKNDVGETRLMIAIKSKKLEGLNIGAMTPRYLNEKSDNGLTALNYAISIGHIELIERLVKAGADINTVDDKKSTPLMQAVYWGRKDVVKKLMELGADINIRDSNGGRAYDFSKGEIKQLLDDSGAKDNFGRNKLIRAVVCNDEKLVDELLARKFEIDAVSDSGQTALDYAITNGPFSIVEKLLKEGANVKKGMPLFLLTTSFPNSFYPASECAEMLIKYGAGFDKISELIYLIWSGQHEAAAKMIQSKDINLNECDGHGQTAIHMAIRMNRWEELKLLIKAGADVNLGLPLESAVGRGEVLGVDLLIQAGANVHAVNSGREPLLHYAIDGGQLSIAERLIKAGADVNARDSAGNTAFHLTLNLAHPKSQKAQNLLIAHKANVSLQNNKGDTPLHLAIASNDVIASAKLIFRTNLSLKNKRGITPLIAAISSEYRSNLIKQILTSGANINQKDDAGNSPLFWAAHLGYTEEVLKLILAGADFDAENNMEQTALSHLESQIIAIENDIAANVPGSHEKQDLIQTYAKILDILYGAGARDFYGRSPIMREIIDHDEDAACANIQGWINKKFDINARDFYGRTAVSYAGRLNKPRILKFLMEAGADIFISCHDDYTPFQYAVAHNANMEVLKQFVSFINPLMIDELRLVYSDPEGTVKMIHGIMNELRKTLPPSEAGKILIWPLLMNCEITADNMMKALSAGEKQFGFEFLSKNYPKANLKWLEDCALGLKHTTCKVIEEVIPLPAGEVDLDILLDMFDKINTRDPKRPGYLDPARLQDDGAPRSMEEIRSTLTLMVNRVKNKTEAFQATPQEGTPELREYYVKLENVLSYIIQKLRDPSCEPDVRTSALFDLAIAGGHCGTRYKTETSAWAKFLLRGINVLTFRDEISKILQNTRVGAVEKMAKECTYPDGQRIEVGNRPHVHNQIVRTIGRIIGISGVDETYDDSAFWLKHLTEDNLLTRFFSIYNISILIDRIDVAINGALDKDGKRIPASQEIHPMVVDAWFKKLAADWKLDKPLLCTTIEFDGVEKALDYQTYIQTVNKEHEAQRKRLASLSEDDIVQDANTKIREFLSSQYRIKLGDEVDPQNWVQVQAAINAQLKELKGGYRSLLEKPETLTEIRNYIEKLKGRPNYTQYALSILLSKFGIIAPSQAQDWEAIKIVIENMRLQEYVDTEIRKNGLIPREKIIRMLSEMGVLSA